MKVKVYPQKLGTLVSLGDLVKWLQLEARNLDDPKAKAALRAVVTELVRLSSEARSEADEYKGRHD